jgi:predicted HTH domain antitoxin
VQKKKKKLVKGGLEERELWKEVIAHLYQPGLYLMTVALTAAAALSTTSLCLSVSLLSAAIHRSILIDWF